MRNDWYPWYELITEIILNVTDARGSKLRKFHGFSHCQSRVVYNIILGKMVSTTIWIRKKKLNNYAFSINNK